MSDKYFLGDPPKALIWIDRSDPRTVHLTVNDSRLVLPGSSKGPGLHLAFNDNPLSANYHPVALKRCLAALQGQGVTTIDLESIFVRDRHIAKRERVIGEWRRLQEPKVPLTIQVPQSRAREVRDVLSELEASVNS